MARPPKDPKLRMDVDLRIPITAAQKQLLTECLSDEPGGMAAWARQILLLEAQKKLAIRDEELQSKLKKQGYSTTKNEENER